MLTLTSDFGAPYPAAMKGVILSITDTRLVDVSHEMPRQDLPGSAFWLTRILPYFPPAVHLVVVDPGVGTDRDVLAVRSGDHVLVGPDNGVLVPPAETLHEDPTYYVVDHDDPESSTFHGRDVFAPIAAEIHDAGIDRLETEDRFTRTNDFETLTLPSANVEKTSAAGSVLTIDDFGNAITSVPGEFIRGSFGEEIEVNGKRVPIARTYASEDPGTALVTVGSHGNVELAVNQGRGAGAFDVDRGDEVVLRLSGVN
ncbi:MAG: S-adenosyl-l-methionine hydroxide adenosyltransferase family protein [Halodesulfurarchaeum sp.]